MLNRKRIQHRPEVGLVKEYSVPTSSSTKFFVVSQLQVSNAPAAAVFRCLWPDLLSVGFHEYAVFWWNTGPFLASLQTSWHLRWGVTPFRIYVGQRLSGKLPKCQKSSHWAAGGLHHSSNGQDRPFLSVCMCVSVWCSHGPLLTLGFLPPVFFRVRSWLFVRSLFLASATWCC